MTGLGWAFKEKVTRKVNKRTVSVVTIINSSKRTKKRSKERNAAIREKVLKYFNQSKYTSWIALADLVINETGHLEVIKGSKHARSIVLSYGKNLNKKNHSAFVKRKPSKDFYASNAWREIRYIALRNSEGCCNLCGARPSDGITLHVDHIIPRSIDHKKELDLNNLQVLCVDCNIGKSNRDSINWKI